jgi:multiple sugar transport system ATP-binding protein
MAQVELRHLEKTFTDPQSHKRVTAVNDLNLTIRDGEFLVLVGPSGCGKTTALRMIAGLEEATGGDIMIGDRRVNDVPSRDRDIAMVFQNYALYPHMSVYDNMAFGLRLKMLPSGLARFTDRAKVGAANAEIDKRIRDAAEMLNMAHLLERKPRALSGGQRQRVALGRAIVREPQVFLMDEPLSNLDAKLRVQTRAELIRLHRRLKTTTVYVTHDQVEAMTMGQRIAVMRDGVLQQCDTPMELYHRPANLFVAGFLGSPPMNFMPAEVEIQGGRPVLKTEDFAVPLPESRLESLRGHAGQEVTLGIRPDAIHETATSRLPAEKSPVELETRVDVIEAMGSESTVFLTIGRQTLVASLDAESRAKEGAPLKVQLDGTAVHVFDKGTELAIV